MEINDTKFMKTSALTRKVYTLIKNNFKISTVLRNFLTNSKSREEKNLDNKIQTTKKVENKTVEHEINRVQHESIMDHLKDPNAT